MGLILYNTSLNKAEQSLNNSTYTKPPYYTMADPKKFSPIHISRFRAGIDKQRELFKQGKSGRGVNNFDMMCDAIENIKSEIKQKALIKGYDKDIANVEKIIKQYRTLEAKYATPTEGGVVVEYPPLMNYKVNLGLTKAYEILMKILNGLNLL